VFTGLAAGTLAPGALNLGSSASEADDRILYDPTSGALYFDHDGSGGTYAAVQFATIGAGQPMTANEVTVI